MAAPKLRAAERALLLQALVFAADPDTEIATRWAAAGLDLSDAGIRARHAPLGTPGQCLEEYLRVRAVADRLRAPNGNHKASDADTHQRRRLLLFRYEDRLRALELHLFGSVLSLPPHDPLLIALTHSALEPQ
jgi:hypothetical protein